MKPKRQVRKPRPIQLRRYDYENSYICEACVAESVREPWAHIDAPILDSAAECRRRVAPALRGVDGAGTKR
jgi:hypothetical protein